MSAFVQVIHIQLCYYRSIIDTIDSSRAETWPSLLATLLASALKCAFLCCRLGPYTALSLELCKLEAQEEGRVWGNLMLVLLNGKPPLPEPSLTGKSERASVATATKNWIRLLEGEQQGLESVDLSGYASCLDITLTLPVAAIVGEVNYETFLKEHFSFHLAGALGSCDGHQPQ